MNSSSVYGEAGKLKQWKKRYKHAVVQPIAVKFALVTSKPNRFIKLRIFLNSHIAVFRTRGASSYIFAMTNHISISCMMCNDLKCRRWFYYSQRNDQNWYIQFWTDTLSKIHIWPKNVRWNILLVDLSVLEQIKKSWNPLEQHNGNSVALKLVLRMNRNKIIIMKITKYWSVTKKNLTR